MKQLQRTSGYWPTLLLFACWRRWLAFSLSSPVPLFLLHSVRSDQHQVGRKKEIINLIRYWRQLKVSVNVSRLHQPKHKTVELTQIDCYLPKMVWWYHWIIFKFILLFNGSNGELSQPQEFHYWRYGLVLRIRTFNSLFLPKLTSLFPDNPLT